MINAQEKYADRSFSLPEGHVRRWPSAALKAAPVWCSTDLLEGNQALFEPLDTDERLRFFKMLADIGFCEIEIGSPASSAAEYFAVRALLERRIIPENVAVQVVTPCRDNLIRHTFEALDGAKRAVFCFYGQSDNRESFLENVSLIRELGDSFAKNGADLRYEYSVTDFSSADIKETVSLCEEVLSILGASESKKVIINLDAGSISPNVFADMVEYFADSLPSRKNAVISVHAANDRGTAVAAAEMALLAGAERIECTLFGCGERAGTADAVTLALNMLSRGINPGLDMQSLPKLRRAYENASRTRIHERFPYAGDLAFTAFSEEQQKAIKSGFLAKRESDGNAWAVPYLPLDPSDVGCRYEPLMRTISRSGSGGIFFTLEEEFGYKIPKSMQNEFSALVQAANESRGSEISDNEMFALFEREYINVTEPYSLVRHSFTETIDFEGHSHVRFDGTLLNGEKQFSVTGEGNGPIDAFFNAIHGRRIDRFTFVDYSEHAISQGSDSRGVAYIHLRANDGTDVFGVGISHNINLAPLRGIVSAINRYKIKQER